jgi:PKD repeat protein
MRTAFLVLNSLSGFLLFMAMLFTGCKEDSNPEPVKLKAAFSATPFEGQSPLTANFKDESTGNPDTWKWDFEGDGSFDAVVSDPSYTYNDPGFYDVKLVVSNDETTDSITILDYIYLNREDIQLNYEWVLSLVVSELAEIPLSIGQDAEIGAMTIKLFYDNRLIKVESIEGDMDGLVDNIVHDNGSIVIAWSSVDPLILAENDVLFRIKANILTGIEPVSHYIRIGAGTEFADPSAGILSPVVLTIPSIEAMD